jgi:integrase/recombinase XerD
MEVVRLMTKDNHIRYYVADDDGLPVEPVLRFLKFKDNTGYARNTLRMYCQHLKQYFTYLGERKKEYTDVSIDDLAGFIAWLQNPYIHQKVVPLLHKPARKARTVNNTVDTVVTFYDYLMRHTEYEGKLPEALVKFIKNPCRNYRKFLHGIAETKTVKSHVLKLRVPHMGLRTIKREEVAELLRACSNLRDYFLLYLLFETGMRIGEILSLWLEDFDSSNNAIFLKDRGELENQAEIKTVSSPRRLDVTQELMDLFTEYICMFHTEGVQTNHVFIKLRGDNVGQAMDYTDVDNLFRVLRKKTDVAVTPHMFRHTSISLLYSAGWEPELLRIRAGHKNIYTTINTYVHPTDEEVAEAFRTVALALKPPQADEEVHGR